MKTKKDNARIIASLVMILLVLLQVILPTETVLANDQIKVGILQYVEHDSLDQTRLGFIDQLKEAGYEDGDKIKIEYLNASADTANLSTMSQKISKSNDYVFVIGTQVAQAMVGLDSQVPVYFSAVSDPVGAGVVDSLEAPGGNITGTTDAGPIKEQLELMRQVYPDAKKVGLIYNSGEANAVSEMSKAIDLLKSMDLEIVEKTIASTNEIQSVMDSLLKESDVVYIVADNTIASSMPLIGTMAVEAGKGLFGGSGDMVLENGLATYGLNYYELGRQTARMLLRQLEEGVEPGEMPVETAEKLNVIVNEDNASALGLELSQFELKPEN